MVWRNSKWRRGYMIIGLLVAALVIFVAAEGLYIKYGGTPVSRPDTPRGEQIIGNGSTLRYVVMGDSTAVSQGGEYSQGYAVKTAEFLAASHAVTWINVAVSGARAADVQSHQLPQVLAYKPEVVLIAVGANDVTHFTSPAVVRDQLGQTIDTLRKQNSAVHIVLTGSPDMGSVPRFPQPVRWLAGERTKKLNAVIIELASNKGVVFAPIAQQTGPYFRRHPEAFAADKFHPNTTGYERWTPVLTEALGQLN